MDFNERGNSYRGSNRESARSDSRGISSGYREMTKVACYDCGIETEVSFKLTKCEPCNVEVVVLTTGSSN